MSQLWNLVLLRNSGSRAWIWLVLGALELWAWVGFRSADPGGAAPGLAGTSLLVLLVTDLVRPFRLGVLALPVSRRQVFWSEWLELGVLFTGLGASYLGRLVLRGGELMDGVWFLANTGCVISCLRCVAQRVAVRPRGRPRGLGARLIGWLLLLLPVLVLVGLPLGFLDRLGFWFGPLARTAAALAALGGAGLYVGLTARHLSRVADLV